MRTLPGVLAALGAALPVLLALPAQAQGLIVTRDASVSARSAYVFRGTQRAEETAQLNAEFRLNGIHVGGSWFEPLSGDELANEARLYGGWSPHIEDHGSPFDLELGFTFYATPEAPAGQPDNSRFEPYATLFLDAPLAPSLSTYYDTELETFSVEGRLTHYVPFGLNGLQFGLDGGHVSPDLGQDHSYAQGSIDFIRNFLGGVEGFVGVRGAVSSEDLYFDTVTPGGPVYDQSAKAWVTMGVAATF